MSEKDAESTQTSTQEAETPETPETPKPAAEGEVSETPETPVETPTSVVDAPVVSEGPSFGSPTEEAAPAVVESEDDSALVSELLTDPKKIVSDIRHDVKKEIRSEMKAEDVEQKQIDTAWTKFYVDNPDLAKARRITELCEREYLTELSQAKKKVSWDEGTKEVAKRARSIISSMGTDSEVVNTDDASKTSEVPSSGGSSTPIEEKEPASGGFMQEMKNLKEAKGVA